MPFSNGVYTPASGAEDATPGEVIRSAIWNSVFTDYATAMTAVGQGVAIEFVARDGPAVSLTSGVKIYIEVPMACTILSWKLMSDQSGSVVLDVWKSTYANFPPTSGNSITGSAPPTITAAQSASSSTLTGWTTNLSQGDILALSVTSCSVIQQVTLSLKCGRN